MNLALLGASGRTGRLIATQALDAGHVVRALVRRPDAIDLKHERLELVVGDATDAAAVRALVSGSDAVISALGPTRDRKDICSTATANVIAAGAKRYVAISGAGLDVPGDDKDTAGKLISFFVRTLTPAIFRDKVREHQLLAASTVGWTLVRPPRLTDRAATGAPRSSLLRPPGSSIPRADLAAFTLACVSDDALIGKAPFVAAP